MIAAVAVFARADFRHPAGPREARAPLIFWSLLLAVWGALNAVFLGGDLFTLFVALELLTFAAVPLVCLDGRAETLQAALRYLLFALLGSVLYLLGVALLYGAYGTLDIAAAGAARAGATGGLGRRRADDRWASSPRPRCSRCTCGCRRPTPARRPRRSAVLSALVVKGSFFLIVRLWFDVLPAVADAGRGAAAWRRWAPPRSCSAACVALRQARLKLLIAYSTVAQIGYLFLMFPLATALSALQLSTDPASTGGMLQAVSHAIAKAAMFLAPG